MKLKSVPQNKAGAKKDSAQEGGSEEQSQISDENKSPYFPPKHRAETNTTNMNHDI